MRVRFRPGYHLVQDEESGIVGWSDEMTKTWDGQVVRKEWADSRHPQTLVPQIPRTEPPIMSRVEALVTAFVCASSFGTVVAGTSITAPWGPLTHLWDRTP